jgi:hypothetical protein
LQGEEMKYFKIIVNEIVTMEYLVEAENEKEAREKLYNDDVLDSYDIDCQMDKILSIKEEKVEDENNEDQSYKSQGDGHPGE